VVDWVKDANDKLRREVDGRRLRPTPGASPDRIPRMSPLVYVCF
jgi:hypothetical protein